MTGTDYPFVHAGDYRGLVADFYLGHRVREFTPPLRLKWLHGVTIPVQTLSSHSSSSSAGLPSPNHAADLWVVDADDRTVFLSTDAEYQSRDWGAYRIHEWLADGAVCRLLQHTESEIAYPLESTPELVLDERASESWPLQVLSITVNGERLSGRVELRQGYNTTMKLSDTLVNPGKRRRNRVFVTASPGGGDGVYPGCENQEVVVRRINQVGPDDKGNFTLAASQCYWINRGGSVAQDGDEYALTVDPALGSGLRVHNNCRPCCSCDDFVNTYKGIRRLYARYKDLGERSQVVRAVYADNRERWLIQKECRESNPLRLEMMPSGAGALAVVMALGNTTGSCLTQGRVDVVFTSASTGVVVANSTLWMPAVAGQSWEMGGLSGAYPNFYALWAPMDPGRAGKIRFYLRFEGAANGDMVTAVATPSFNGIAGNPVTVTRSLIV